MSMAHRGANVRVSNLTWLTTWSSPPPPYREKYVTRAEYDELKSRFDALEQTVSNYFRAPAGNVPQYYQMPMGAGMPGGPPTNVSSYNPPPHPPQQAGMGYQMMAPATYIQPPQPPHHRYPGPESPRAAASPRHMQHPTGTMQSPTTSPVIQTPHGGSAPSPSRNPKSPQSAKNSPLSLASITTPFNTAETQSKNYQRRRILGERLRLVTREDPVVRCNGAQRWKRQQRRARKSSWLGDRLTRVCHSKYSLGIPGGTVILLS
jgi:hypothetical protein